MSYIDASTPTEWDKAYAASKTEEMKGMYEGTKCDRNLSYAEARRMYPEIPEESMRQFVDAENEARAEPPARSLRYNNGKPDFSLLPLSTLTEVVRVLEYGAEKYERNNWLKPTNWEVSFGCLMRHMSAWQAGEDNDPESGRSHLAHAACNILQMLHQLENHPEELER